MKRRMKGSFIIEAASIVPLILLIFVVSVNILFYYHDKNVIEAAAHETAAFASTHEKNDENEWKSHFYSRINGKTLLFTKVQIEAKLEDGEVKLVCSAKKDYMSLRVTCSMRQTNPENYIRNIRKIEKITEGIGK